MYPIQAIRAVYFTVMTQKIIPYDVKQMDGCISCTRPAIQSGREVIVFGPVTGAFGTYRQSSAREGSSERASGCPQYKTGTMKAS